MVDSFSFLPFTNWWFGCWSEGDAWGDGITTYNPPCGNVDDMRDGREPFVTSLTSFKGYLPRWLPELQWGETWEVVK